jgi:SAM-dependent methyltransferase
MIKDFLNYLLWHYRRYQDLAFDRKNGLDTDQGHSDYLEHTESANKAFAVAYEPVQVFMFRRMMKDLAIPCSDYTFVDLGSGKGRALVLAQQQGFLNIIGVEFSPQLHAIAKNNVKTFSARSRHGAQVTLLCQDAAEFNFPQSDIALFLYNPFFGPAMEAVIKKIERFIAEEPFDLVIFYRNPRCAELIDALPGLYLASSEDSYRIYRRKADIHLTVPPV